MEQGFFNENAFLFQDFKFQNGCFAKQDHLFMYMIIHVKYGKMHLKINGTDYIVHKGETLYIPEGSTNLEYSYIGAPYHGYTLRFRFFPNVKRIDYPAQIVPTDDKIIKLMNEIPITAPFSLEKIWKFYRYLSYLQSNMKRNEEKDVLIVEKALEYMNANNNYDIATLARICNISESGFRAIFKKITGTTVIEEKHAIQAFKAEVLLRSTDLSIEEISREIGFKSIRHFRKVFAKRYGKTPNEIRSAVYKQQKQLTESFFS